MEWDDAAFAQAAALRAQGLTWSVIAGRMGTTRNSVVCAFLRAGIELPQVPDDVQRRYAPRVGRRCDAVKPDQPRRKRRPRIDATMLHADKAWAEYVCSDPGCCRSLYYGSEYCLGHLVLHQRESYTLKLTLLGESATPRRLAEAIRDRIKTKGWTTREWAAQVGLPPSTANKAVRAPDSHPKSFARIADYFGYSLDPRTGTYRRKAQESSVA